MPDNSTGDHLPGQASLRQLSRRSPQSTPVMGKTGEEGQWGFVDCCKVWSVRLDRRRALEVRPAGTRASARAGTPLLSYCCFPCLPRAGLGTAPRSALHTQSQNSIWKEWLASVSVFLLLSKIRGSDWEFRGPAISNTATGTPVTPISSLLPSRCPAPTLALQTILGMLYLPSGL